MTAIRKEEKASRNFDDRELILLGIDAKIEDLESNKEFHVRNQDFPRAAEIRDEIDDLKRYRNEKQKKQQI